MARWDSSRTFLNIPVLRGSVTTKVTHNNHVGDFGDRRQQLVFIGAGLNEAGDT